MPLSLHLYVCVKLKKIVAKASVPKFLIKNGIKMIKHIIGTTYQHFMRYMYFKLKNIFKKYFIYFNKFIHVFQGWMEETAMFNGYYVDKKVKLAASNYNLPLAYFLVTVAVMLMSLVVMVRK